MEEALRKLKLTYKIVGGYLSTSGRKQRPHGIHAFCGHPMERGKPSSEFIIYQNGGIELPGG